MGSSPLVEHRRCGVFYYGIKLAYGGVFLYLGVLCSPSFPSRCISLGKPDHHQLRCRQEGRGLAHWPHTPTWPPFSVALSHSPSATNSQLSSGTKPSAYLPLPQSFPQQQRIIKTSQEATASCISGAAIPHRDKLVVNTHTKEMDLPRPQKR